MKFKKLILATAVSSVLFSQATTYHALVIKQKYKVEENTGAIKPNPTEWLSFLKSEGQLLNLNYMYEVTSQDSITLGGRNNANIPLGSLGFEKIDFIDFSGNDFDSVDFLEGVKTVENNLNLTDSSLYSIDGLIDLRNVGHLNFSPDSSFISLLPLRGLKAGNISLNRPLDDFDQYTEKLFANDSLCLGISSGQITFNNVNGISPNSFCSSADEWMNFFHDKDLFLSYSTQSQLLSNKYFELSDMSLNQNNIPQSDFVVETPYQMDLSNNNFTNVDFLKNVLENKFSNSSEHSSYTPYIDLRGNIVSDISGLSNMLRTGNNNINSGIFFDETSTFTNLDGLKNLSLGNIHLNRPLEGFVQNTELWGYANPICPAIYKNKVSLFDAETELEARNLCTTNDGWMDFFHDENLFLEYAYQKDVPKTTGYNLYNKALTNNDLPSSELTFTENGAIYFYNNNLTNVDFLSNLTKTTSHLYLQDNNLNNLNGLSNLTRVGSSFHIANNNLTNLDGLEKLDYVSSLYAEGNVLENINGLSALTDINVNAYFDPNSTFTDISPLSNLIDGDIYLNRNIDGFDQQTNKLSFSTPFCQAIIANTVNVYGVGNVKQNPIEMCTTSDDWMDLFHDNAQLEAYATQAEVPNGSGYNLYNKGLTNNDLPSSELTFSEGGGIYLYKNELTNIDFLSNLTKTTSHLYLQDNNLTNLNGLSNLTRVGSSFHLANNNLTNLDGLEKLDYVNYLYTEGNILENINGLSALTDINVNASFDSNSTFTDISPLSNLIDGEIYLNRNIDGFDQQTNKLSFSTPFCQGIIANTVNMYGVGNVKQNPIEMCTTSDNWMDLFHDNAQLEAYATQAEVPNNASYNLYNKGISNSNLPSDELTFTESGGIYLYKNNLTDLDFLSNLTKIASHFYLQDNNLTNLNGLSNLTRVGSSFHLANNNLTNLDGLEKLDYVNYLYTEGNILENINGLSALTDINVNASFDSNSTFTDISPLSNLIDGEIYLNRNIDGFDQQTNKLSFSTPFCQGIVANTINMYGVGNVKQNPIEMCTTNDDWMDLFHDAGQLSLYSTQLEVPANTSYTMSSLGLNNSDLPTSELTLTTGGSLLYNNNDFTNVDFLSNLTIATGHLYLQDNNLPNLNGLSNLTKVGSHFRINNNNLTNLDGLENLDYMINFYTSGNILENINGLSGLTDIQGTAYFGAGDTFTDLSPLSNLTDGEIYLYRNIDNFDQQTNKLDYSTPFCQGVIANVINIYGIGNVRQNPIEMCTTNDDWMDLFHDAGQLELYTGQLEVPVNTSYTMSSLGLNNSNIPTSELILTTGGSLLYNNNDFTNVDFLSNLTIATGHLYLQDNNLTNLNGLSNLTKVGSHFRINNNNLTNLDGLENLDYMINFYTIGNTLENINGLSGLTDIQGTAYFSAGDTFTDLSPLSNLTDGEIYLYRNIDNFVQQTNKLDYSTPFCQGIIANTINIYGVGSVKQNPIEMCTTNDEWLDLFHEGGQLEPYTTQAEVPLNTSYTMSSLSLNNSNIPTSELTLTTGGSILYNNNDFTNVDFLSNLTIATGHLYLNYNNLTNLNGLGNLTRVNSHFRINNNNLTNLDGLESLDYMGNFYATGNALANINGLSGLTDINGAAYFSANDTFTDLAPLSNLTDGEIYLYRNIDNFVQQTNKLDYSTPFCQGIIANVINIYGVSNVKQNPIEMCTTNDEWMDFFHDNAQLEPYATQLEVPQYTPYILSSKNLTNDDLPSSELTFTSNDYIYLQSNNLTNVDFLSNLTKSTSHIYLQNNDLTNLNGLSNLESVTSYLRLDNNNLTNLNGLESLKTANRIYTEGNNLTNINGLSGLTSVNYLYFDLNSTFTNLSPLLNLTKGNIYLKRSKENFTQYTSKWESTTPVCQAILNNTVNFYNQSNVEISSYMCN